MSVDLNTDIEFTDSAANKVRQLIEEEGNILARLLWDGKCNSVRTLIEL